MYASIVELSVLVARRFWHMTKQRRAYITGARPRPLITIAFYSVRYHTVLVTIENATFRMQQQIGTTKLTLFVSYVAQATEKYSPPTHDTK